MRKLIWAFAVLLLASGCKQKVSYKNLTHEELQEVNRESMLVSKSLSVRAATLDETIVMDMSAITDTVDWISRNNNYFPTPKPSDPNTGCAHLKNYISVIKYLAFERDTTKIKFSGWLNTNGSAICYNETNDYIENAHKVVDRRGTEYLDARSQFVIGEIKFSQIKQALANVGITDLKTAYYKKWVKLYLKSPGKFAPKIMNDYNPYVGGYYSVPFLNILASKYADASGEVTFKFIEGQMYGSYQTFLFVTAGGKNYYYDFSQIPTGLPAGIYFYLFSPL